jgi:hypothetical protein
MRERLARRKGVGIAFRVIWKVDGASCQQRPSGSGNQDRHWEKVTQEASSSAGQDKRSRGLKWLLEVSQ